MADTLTKKKTTRFSKEQTAFMVDFFYENPGLAGGKFLAQRGKEKHREKWEELAEALNALNGGIKNVQQWQTVI